MDRPGQQQQPTEDAREQFSGSRTATTRFYSRRGSSRAAASDRNPEEDGSFGFNNVIAYALSIEDAGNGDEPTSFKEAMNCKEAHAWEEAMIEEMNSLHKNQTWKVVDRPTNQKVVKSKWVYKLKPDKDDKEKPRFKARLVAKGFTQVEGIDYQEIFSPVVKHTSIRVLLSIVAKFDLELDQMDVKTAFLHGNLEETIYMEEAEGFESRKQNQVCLLKRPIYGLKQSSRRWYLRFHNFITSCGFERCLVDSCVYIRRGADQHIKVYLLLYVDDILLASMDRIELDKLKEDLGKEFDMKDLGKAERILGIQISRDRRQRKLYISQSNYFQKVLERSSMPNCKPVSIPFGQHFRLSKGQIPMDEEERRYMEKVPYSNIIGCIMYGMLCTRPDLAYCISLLSRFMAEPRKEHWEALKWVLRYIKGTLHYGIMYGANSIYSEDIMTGFTDSDYGKCVDSRRSISGFIFTVYGGAVSWKSSLQHVVALSTTEAEYIAATEAAKEGIWLQELLRELHLFKGPFVLHCDNQSAIYLVNNPVSTNRSKHIDIRIHFIRNLVDEGLIKMAKIATAINPSDALTKALSREKTISSFISVCCGLESSFY